MQAATPHSIPQVINNNFNIINHFPTNGSEQSQP
jgi:hypothetical protein